jgi:hypothetical protein
MKLTVKNVEEVFVDSLYRDEEIEDGQAPEDAVIVAGIVNMVGFHPKRVESHRDEITSMLHQLPNEFLSVNLGGEGGWSFLNALDTKDGDQWTGSHQSMEQLVLLGIAVGAARYNLDRELWPSLPGGVPYFEVIE